MENTAAAVRCVRCASNKIFLSTQLSSLLVVSYDLTTLKASQGTNEGFMLAGWLYYINDLTSLLGKVKITLIY